MEPQARGRLPAAPAAPLRHDLAISPRWTAPANRQEQTGVGIIYILLHVLSLPAGNRLARPRLPTCLAGISGRNSRPPGNKNASRPQHTCTTADHRPFFFCFSINKQNQPIECTLLYTQHV